MANTIDQEALDASAGPSTPRPTVRASPEPPSSPVPSLSPPVEIVTPAPLPRPEDPPNAPTQLPPAKSIPDHTPSSSVTPTAQPHPDVSEFDPYATPVPRAPGQPSSASAPVRQAETAAKDNGASEPVFNFSGFLKDLRLKSSEPVARFLKSFLANFARKPFTVNEQIKLIHDFLEFIAEKMAQCETWKSQSSLEFDNALEAMEKLVMNRLYNFTFTPQLVPAQPITTDDLERDTVFAQRVRLFGWIREKHLDVPEGEASLGFLGFAEQELLKINHYKAPRDKMICILNCCKVIFGLIRHTYGPDSASADTFVPILIFVVLRANPENMLSNIEYINRFRTASKLQGEAGYYLSSLSGAIAFIETMDASTLSNITQDEFERNVEEAIQDLPPSPSSTMSRHLGPTEMSPFGPSTPGEEPARPLSLSTSFPALDNTKRFFQRTGNQVQEAVSKPLNAITKILDNMQQEGSESGDEAEQSWQAGGSRDQEADLRHDMLHQQTPPARLGSRQAFTPDSPTRRLAQLGLSPDSRPSSGTGTPLRDVSTPDFSSEQLQTTIDMSQESYAQTRQANVHTLHQMFPALDEEVVEAVLESCGNDLGVAIDRLLEM